MSVRSSAPAPRGRTRPQARRLRRRALLGLLGLLAVALVVVGPSAYIYAATSGHRVSRVAAAPAAPVALVFGAGLGPDGTPGPFLRQRMDLAIAAYQARKVQSLLLSGDGTGPYHDEPDAMSRYAQQRGVPSSAIDRDPQGIATYDSCLRARTVYGVQRALVVTQTYHLPRAVYVCRQLGVDATGLGASELRRYPGATARYAAREALASANALRRLHLG